MNTRIQSFAAAFVAAILFFTSLPSGKAFTTSTAYSEDFSGVTSVPSDWSDQIGAWYYSSSDGAGSSGSIVCDIYDYWYASDVITTPVIDASLWSSASDNAYVDFDFFWEYNDYNAAYGDDNFQVYLQNSSGQTLVLDLKTSSDYTYNDADGSYNVMFNPSTSSGDWRHYHIPVPQAYRTSTLQIAFQDNPGWGASNPAIDNIVVSGTHFNALAYAPTGPIKFGSVTVGDISIAKSIILQNPNPVSVNITNVNLSDPNFQIVHMAASLPPGTEANPSIDSISIVFEPTVGGPITGTVSFNTDADVPTSVSVDLSGTGVTPLLQITAAQPLFARTHVRLGDTLTAVVYVRNASVGEVKISPLTSIGGDNPSDYSIVSLPSSGVENGSVDSIVVAFHPTFEGGHSATLTVQSNGGSQQLQLGGNGILPRILVSPASFVFPATPIGTTVCQSFTISNPGTDTLQIGRDYLSSSDADFSMTALNSSDMTILPGASKNVSVCFTPVEVGSRLATLRLTTNIPLTYTSPRKDTSDMLIQITGTGLAVGHLVLHMVALDSSVIGTQVCQTDTLWNTGNADFAVTRGAFSGGDSLEFSFGTQVFPVTVPAGSFSLVNICFTPSDRGVRMSNALFIGASDGANASASLSVVGVGLAVCASVSPSAQTLFSGTKTLVGTTDTVTVTITNCGDVATSYDAAFSAGATTYSILGAATTPVVQPGGNGTFRVLFTPSDRTTSNAMMTVTGGTGVTPMNIPLSGTGESVTVQATGEAGDVVQGTFRDFTVTISNVGNMDWTPGATSISGTDASDFTVVTAVIPATIAANATGTLTLRFTPATTAAETATLTFPSALPAPQPGFSYLLTGNSITSGVANETPGTLAFNEIYPNPITSGTSSITFSTPSDAIVSLSIFDAKGSAVQTLVNGRLTAGAHTITVRTQDMPSGTYFCVLQVGGTRLMREIAVVK